MRFASGEGQRYDIVVGADGMHSATRRLTFGPEDQFLRHLGFYVALAQLPDYTQPDRRNPMYNTPGRMAGIATYRDKALAVFMFRSPWIDYDYHDLDAQKQILRDAFAGHAAWKVPNYSTPPRRQRTLLRLGQPDPHADLAPRARCVGGRCGALRVSRCPVGAPASP